MFFYIYCSDLGKFYVSPLKDDNSKENYEFLTPGLPLSFAQSVLYKVQGKGSRISRRNKEPYSETSLKSEIIKLLEKNPALPIQPWQWEHNNPEFKDGHDLDDDLREDFYDRIKGRVLAKADLQRLAVECGLTYEEVLGFCQETVLQGRGEWLPAVKKEHGTWRCQRCGEAQVEEWISIYGQTATCPSCSALGSLSSLHALYRSIDSHEESIDASFKVSNQLETPLAQDKLNSPVVFSPRWELSQAQKLAAQEVLEFVKTQSSISREKPNSNYRGEPLFHTEVRPWPSFFSLGRKKHKTHEYPNREILLWAACGAGKTEVCFPAVAWALAQGKKVLFAAPRQDVVLDVAPRIQQDFPGLKTAVLTGVSPERFTPAPFVLATTHQILRFYQAFDLIFLDEMDAFPYYGSAALAWGVQQALKPKGQLVYLTATPSTESLAKVKEGKIGIIRLPARHHRRGVPVPQWRKVNGGLEPERLGKRVEARQVFHLVEELAVRGPVLLFVPKISWVNPWVDLLQQEFPQWKIAGSYSADPLRREKIEGLRQKKYQAFVCTLILERGVTIADAQVIVLAADHEVFDERALVQMAGRVGRTQENPTGTALFLAPRKTSGIEKAIHWITEQNLLAKELGLID